MVRPRLLLPVLYVKRLPIITLTVRPVVWPTVAVPVVFMRRRRLLGVVVSFPVGVRLVRVVGRKKKTSTKPMPPLVTRWTRIPKTRQKASLNCRNAVVAVLP